jgi:hypothetical protein
MMSVMSLKIQIERDIESLGAIFSLYRKDSATLGFMPEGAFVQAIADGKIIVVKNSDRLLGYLFFRVSNGRATIVHLCVSSTDRGQGLARLMINELKLITSYLECIILRCRGDFEVNKAWPKFGFHAVSQITGRGADRAKLTVWTFDHGHQNLFSNCTNDKIQVAIDNNIFLDLINPNRPQHEVSNGLTEPWLDDLIELVVTPEIYNDIHRCLKNDELVSTRLKLEKYTKLRASAFDVQKLYEVLYHKYPDLYKGSRGESDIRHIAYSIVAGVKYFVTRDGGILGIAAEISQDYDLQILDPVDLIGRHDLLERESEYQPARLCATQLVTCRLKPEMFEYAIKHFRCKDREKTHQFR